MLLINPTKPFSRIWCHFLRDGTMQSPRCTYPMQQNNIMNWDLQGSINHIVFIWGYGTRWQLGITPPPPRSSTICLIGFRREASLKYTVPGGQREQQSGRIRGECEGQLHFERYDYSPRSEQDGFHTWQFGGSAHTACTKFNGWPQAMWAKSAKEVEQSEKKKRKAYCLVRATE